MADTTIRGSTRGVRIAAMVSLALVAASVTACGSTAPAPPTTRVERGQVSTKVSASGALAAVSSQNLGFAKAAQLIELSVKVGDTVRAGQVLAREDPFSFQQIVNQQAAQLNQQVALLDKAVRSPLVHGDGRSVDQLKRIYDATKDSGDALHSKDQNSVFRARQALDFARQQYRAAVQTYQACKASEGLTTGPCNSVTGDPTGSVLAADKTAVANAYGGTGGVLQAKTALDTAKHTLDVDDTTSRINNETARGNLVTGQNTYNSDNSDKAPSIASQAAVVANYRALLANAQRDLDNTVLYAPVAGNISPITGAVGEYLGSGGGTSALAPGTDAAIPGVGAAATADQSSASASGAPSATRPGGSAFMVINNINTFQVVVPFEESDAAKVAPNQKVQVTFDALPDLTRDGTVLSIAPGGVDISGV
ncbi:MAG TPA: HlyD family efflux transporter periplasmic adaptor subunit, partial [Pseudonocardia sp.]|nr:HlyD family efflux transporter periplasmic adaptor subunit [Pseudonocardia sp.]